ncbi:Uncharacterised protein [Leclercia adecarboxylata]|uniref:Uncharacterized protein n=1 Tax=Leclercia adecarboxylata TaxID=83655 RepID=A0A4U9IV54_9ENTR|nr:Uncharacterised protein [Leclercia adecarboxylata]
MQLEVILPLVAYLFVVFWPVRLCHAQKDNGALF